MECKRAGHISSLNTAIYLLNCAAYDWVQARLHLEGHAQLWSWVIHELTQLWNYARNQSQGSTHPQLHECLNHLATALLIRFIYTGQAEDVHRAVRLRAGAVLGHPVQDIFISMVRRYIHLFPSNLNIFRTEIALKARILKK